MKIGVFGGDKRMLFAAKAFSEDGCEVAIAGFDSLMSLCEIRVCGIEEAAAWCDIAVLPVRPITDGCLNTPFSQERIEIRELLRMLSDKPIFTGCAEQLKPYSSGEIYDYTIDEGFLYRNAELTAEGALGILLNDYEGSVFDAKILITGFGRIGKMLTRMLSALGADVTVAARKASDRALISLCGSTAIDYPCVDHGDYDIVINTVPALIIDKCAVDRMKEEVFLIDLASMPGGIDFKRAEGKGLTCIHALSLPGKTAPLAAGAIIKDTIMKRISSLSA